MLKCLLNQKQVDEIIEMIDQEVFYYPLDKEHDNIWWSLSFGQGILASINARRQLLKYNVKYLQGPNKEKICHLIKYGTPFPTCYGWNYNVDWWGCKFATTISIQYNQFVDGLAVKIENLETRGA